MKLKELKEDGFINLIKKLTTGIGDDCAVITFQGKTLLVTTDSMVEGTHFTLSAFQPHQVGTKALLSTISDIIAKGGIPLYITVSLAAPAETEVETLEEIYRGMAEAAREHNCHIIGGDTCKSPIISLSLTAIGEAPYGAIKRKGAHPKDLVVVTGFPGTSAIGLEALLNGYPYHIFQKFIDRHTHPTLRGKFALALAQEKIATSAMDISDGLVMDLERLCRENQVGAVIEREKLPVPPVSPQHKNFLKHPLLHYVLHGGEEYELLLTVPPVNIKRLEKIAASTQTPIHIIGTITEETGLYLLNGEKQTLKHKGYSHF